MKTTLLTCASGSIGEAFAQRLAAEKHHLEEALCGLGAVLRPPDRARLAQLDHGVRLAVPGYQEAPRAAPGAHATGHCQVPGAGTGGVVK